MAEPPPNYDAALAAQAGAMSLEAKTEEADDAGDEEEWPSLGVYEGIEDIDPSDTAAIIARMPAMFVAAEKGDVEKAKARWLDTIAWRRENKVGQILRTPYPKYKAIRSLYPMYYHLKDKEGYPVYIERPSKIDLPKMKEIGVTQDDILYHSRFSNEFCWTYVNRELPPKGRSTSIIDIEGMGVSSVGGEIMDTIKKMVGTIGKHYPERCQRVFIVNAPWYFSTVWKMVRVFVDPVTVAKTHILKSSEVTKTLSQYIEMENIPTLYGGTCKIPLGEAPEEDMLNKLVEKLNRKRS